MPYLGTGPIYGDLPVKTFTGDGSATTFSLDHSVPSDSSIIVSIDGVRQHVGSYTAAGGTTLDFLSVAPASGTSIEVVHLGIEASLNTPADASVTNAKIVDGTIAGSKIEANPNIDESVVIKGGSNPGKLVINCEANTHGITIQSPAHSAGATYTLTLPNNDGDASQFLQTNGSGVMTWADAGVSTIAALSDATVSASDPTISSNPSGVGHLWLNSTSGEGYIATDATAGDNVWTNIGGGSGSISSSYTVEYLVIGGGGAGGGLYRAGGGGAGGYRNSYASETSGRASSTETAWSVLSGNTLTVTVGAAGAMADNQNGGPGGTSSIALTGQTTVTSYGGGGGGKYQTNATAGTYGSGAGAGHHDGVVHNGSLGTAAQGFDGGDTAAASNPQGGTGGGAGANGVDGGTTSATAGGDGLASEITGSSVTRAGGGGAGSYGSGEFSSGGSGGAGNGGSSTAGDPHSGVSDGSGYYYPTSATVNSGSGGGGVGGANADTAYGNGGSGVVILRMPATNYTGTTTGSPTVATDGTDKVLTFTGSGTYST